MNLSILLVFTLLVAVAVVIILVVKNSIMAQKNKLYHEFVKRTSPRKFFSILEETNYRVIDSNITMMLQKYFELVLLRLDKKDVSALLSDLDKSKYSGILRKGLTNAAAKTGDGIFGLALALSIDKPADKLAIEYFLTGLPEKQKKDQYKVAFNVLKEDYDRRLFDYPSEYRRPVEQAMKEFEKSL